MADFEKGSDENILGEAICFFDCYILEHFGDEELLQQKHDYPKYEAHKAEHEAMIRDFERYKKRYETEGYSRALAAETLAILSIWLKKHFQQSDRDFILFLRKFFSVEKYKSGRQTVAK